MTNIDTSLPTQVLDKSTLGDEPPAGFEESNNLSNLRPGDYFIDRYATHKTRVTMSQIMAGRVREIERDTRNDTARIVFDDATELTIPRANLWSHWRSSARDNGTVVDYSRLRGAPVRRTSRRRTTRTPWCASSSARNTLWPTLGTCTTGWSRPSSTTMP